MPLLHTRRFNLEALLKSLLLLGFSSYIFYSILSEEILLYVHPRLIPFLYLTAGLMMMMAFGTIREVVKIPRKRIEPITYSLFLIPLLMVYLIPPEPIDSQILSNRSINLETGIATQVPSTRFPVGKGVILDDRSFSPWYFELHQHPKSYLGSPVSGKGFLIEDENLEENYFFLTRFLMVCCIADMQLIGILAYHPKAHLFQEDTWLEIHGILQNYHYKGQTIPLIEGKEIKEIERPQVPYVYPSFHLPSE